MKIFIVMIGGFFGALSRYVLGEWFYSSNGFPTGTLTINLIGCLFLGWFLTFVSKRQRIKPELSLFIGTGFVGSFTTFSTFSVETVQLFQNSYIVQAVFYVFTSIILGLLMTYIGWKLALSIEKEGETG
jgi:fluoride exporter